MFLAKLKTNTSRMKTVSIWQKMKKETYISAIDIINSELRLTGETSLVRKMYDILQDTKASLLREEIIENELYSQRFHT